MRALELLKIIYKDSKIDWEDKGFAVTYPTNDIKEAIKELEYLQKRSCKNCKYKKTCFIAAEDNKKFYCSDWELK